MTNYTLKAETGYFFVSPYFFVLYGEDFYQACRSHISDNRFSPAQYYLACRSIELSLKAFLLLKGVPRSDLKAKPLGHDLARIYEKCVRLGLEEFIVLSRQQKDDIQELNKWYARKGFEYFELESLTSDFNLLPSVFTVLELANGLILALKQPCKDEANKP